MRNVICQWQFSTVMLPATGRQGMMWATHLRAACMQPELASSERAYRAQLRAHAWEVELSSISYIIRNHGEEICLPACPMNISSFIPPSSKRQENFSSLSNSCFSLLSSRSQQLITCFVTWPIYTFTILLKMSSYGSSSCASNGSAKRFIHHSHIPWTALKRPDIALQTPNTARKPVTCTRTILLLSLDQKTALRDALPHIRNTRIPLRVNSNSKT